MIYDGTHADVLADVDFTTHHKVGKHTGCFCFVSHRVLEYYFMILIRLGRICCRLISPDCKNLMMTCASSKTSLSC
jgi:hypothetical protein